MFELWRLQREEKKTSDYYAKRIEELERQKCDGQTIEAVRQEAGMELGIVEEQIRAVVTRRILRRARRHFLPTPDYGKEPFWERGFHTGSYYLTDQGIKAVREELYNFSKRRTEFITTAATMLIGLIGAATGLLAVILR